MRVERLRRRGEGEGQGQGGAKGGGEGQGRGRERGGDQKRHKKRRSAAMPWIVWHGPKVKSQSHRMATAQNLVATIRSDKKLHPHAVAKRAVLKLSKTDRRRVR